MNIHSSLPASKTLYYNIFGGKDIEIYLQNQIKIP